jgi:tetratricopeptide (TPR) repeat protein
LQDADQIVSALRGGTPVSAQIVFLSGKLHEARGDWAGAISEYRYLLTARPDLTRVRLELARALYASGEYDQARFHFERALGDDPPAAVRSNIERYLDRIRRRRLALDLSLELVPDDNFNQAPADDRLILFGQEYVLSQAAQPRSGVGLWVGLRGRLAPSSGEWTPFLTVSGDYQSYPGSEFDFLAGDVSLGVQRRMASRSCVPRPNISTAPG